MHLSWPSAMQFTVNKTFAAGSCNANHYWYAKAETWFSSKSASPICVRLSTQPLSHVAISSAVHHSNLFFFQYHILCVHSNDTECWALKMTRGDEGNDYEVPPLSSTLSACSDRLSDLCNGSCSQSKRPRSQLGVYGSSISIDSHPRRSMRVAVLVFSD
jgi:hypothetical protein